MARTQNSRTGGAYHGGMGSAGRGPQSPEIPGGAACLFAGRQSGLLLLSGHPARCAALSAPRPAKNGCWPFTALGISWVRPPFLTVVPGLLPLWRWRSAGFDRQPGTAGRRFSAPPGTGPTHAPILSPNSTDPVRPCRGILSPRSTADRPLAAQSTIGR